MPHVSERQGLQRHDEVRRGRASRADLIVDGTATVVVVVDGTATLRGASVETLVVVDGAAVLGKGTVVTGDVVLPSSTITDDGSTRTDGNIGDNLSGFSRPSTALATCSPLAGRS